MSRTPWSVDEGGAPALPEELLSRVLDVVRAEERVRLAEADHAYQLALLAREASARRLPSGRSALAACARAVGVARTTLTAFSLVAHRWNLREVRALLLQRDARGKHLSVTHLIAMAQLPKSARTAWIERALGDGLDVRALKRALREQPTATSV